MKPSADLTDALAAYISCIQNHVAKQCVWQRVASPHRHALRFAASDSVRDRHCESVGLSTCCRWKLPEATCQGQILLLHSLHSHSMQLLAQARDELLPDCCTASSSGIQGGARCSDSGSLQQQQRQAWQLCVAQVQHNLLLVMQLSKHWQDSNVLGGYQPTFEEYMTHRWAAKASCCWVHRWSITAWSPEEFYEAARSHRTIVLAKQSP